MDLEEPSFDLEDAEKALTLLKVKLKELSGRIKFCKVVFLQQGGLDDIQEERKMYVQEKQRLYYMT